MEEKNVSERLYLNFNSAAFFVVIVGITDEFHASKFTFEINLKMKQLDPMIFIFHVDKV